VRTSGRLRRENKLRRLSASERKGSRPHFSRTLESSSCLNPGNLTPWPQALAASPRRVLTLAALSRMGIITECLHRPPWVSAIHLRMAITTMEDTLLSSTKASSRLCKGPVRKRTITTLSTTSRTRLLIQATGVLMPNPFSTIRSLSSTLGQPTSRVDPLTPGVSDLRSSLSSGRLGTQAQTTPPQARITLNRSSKSPAATSNCSRFGCQVKRSPAIDPMQRTLLMKNRGSLTSMSPATHRGKPCVRQAAVQASNSSQSTRTRTSERPSTLHRWTLMFNRSTT